MLQASGMAVRVDVSEVQPGTNFVAFMESALGQSDYFLLLWSRAARDSRWVALEWESALHRAVSDSPGFLIVGRLENVDMPVLLRSRLSVDLYPQILPGLQRVIAALKSDASAADQTNLPVVKPRIAMDDDADGARIYVTSKLFGKTFPLRVRLNTPALVVADRVVTLLGLARETTAFNGIGMRFEYALATDTGPLRDTATLEQQGIVENCVLWLETTPTMIAGLEPVRTVDGRATYRSAPAPAAHAPSLSIWLHARDVLRARIVELGLQ